MVMSGMMWSRYPAPSGDTGRLLLQQDPRLRVVLGIHRAHDCKSAGRQMGDVLFDMGNFGKGKG